MAVVVYKDGEQIAVGEYVHHDSNWLYVERPDVGTQRYLRGQFDRVTTIIFGKPLNI